MTNSLKSYSSLSRSESSEDIRGRKLGMRKLDSLPKQYVECYGQSIDGPLAHSAIKYINTSMQRIYPYDRYECLGEQ